MFKSTRESPGSRAGIIGKDTILSGTVPGRQMRFVIGEFQHRRTAHLNRLPHEAGGPSVRKFIEPGIQPCSIPNISS